MRNNIPPESMDACLRAANQSLYTCRSLIESLKHDRDDLKNALEDQDLSEKDRYGINYQAAHATSFIQTLEDREKFLDARLEHAFKRLKAKKLYADTLDGISAVCEDRHLTQTRAVLQMILCTMDHPILRFGAQGQIDEACWKIGIDMTMLEEEPELAASDSMFATALEPNIHRIFINSALAAYASKVGMLLNTDSYNADIANFMLQKYDENQSMQESVQGVLAERLADLVCSVLETMDVPEDKPQPDQTIHPDPQEIAKARADAIAKAVAPIQARVDKLTQHNTDLESELSRLKSENQALYEALADRERALSDYATRENAISPDDLPELPESGIIFAGGHENMTKKIRQDHPGWTFIHGRDVNFPAFQNPKLVFIWDKHIAHPSFWRVRKFTPPGTPQIYLKSTNINMLETEMRRAWAAQINKS